MYLKWTFRQTDSSLSLDTFSSYMPSVRSLPEATQKAKETTCLCHAPTAVETAENMAALNVDYIAWIITVLGAINSNHTFIRVLGFVGDISSSYDGV